MLSCQVRHMLVDDLHQLGQLDLECDNIGGS